MKLAKCFSGVRIDKRGDSLPVDWSAEYALGDAVLPASGRTKAHDQLPKCWIGMVEMRFLEGNQLIRKLAWYTPLIVAVGYEVSLLRGQQVRRHGTSTSVIELPTTRLRLTLDRADVAEISFTAVDPSNPKSRS